MAAQDRTDLEQRYGRRTPRLTPVQHYTVITVALLLGVIVAFVVFRNSEQPVQGVVDDFRVTDATHVVVTYEVHKTSSLVATCVVRARDEAGAQVGAATVTIPAGAPVTQPPFTLTTTDRAITGEIEDCGPADQ